MATDDRYELTKHDGKTVDKYTDYNLKLAEKRLGYDLTIVQGSYNKGGVKASAGTHDGGGCVDLLPWDWQNKVRVLRELGFAAWHRPYIKGVWGEHIHAVLIGNEKLAPVAAQQIVAYRNGRDGLKSNAKDTFWRPNPIVDAAYKTTPSAPAPVLGVDYSFARPKPATIKGAGYSAVGRYLSHSPSKNISSTEAKGLHAAGLGIFLVWETTAKRAAAGKDAGIADAKEALFQANTLSVPVNVPLFFAVDFDAQFPQVSSYLAAARSVVGDRAGVYGGYRITTAARAAGFGFTWQTMAWSAGKVDADANVLQRLRPTVKNPIQDTDENLIQKAFPLW